MCSEATQRITVGKRCLRNSGVNKDSSLKAKDRTKDLTLKANDRNKD